VAKTENVVLTNMVMVENGDLVLVQDRTDPDWPGMVFPGGHVEKGESFVRSAVREVKEETGLTVWDLKLCGIKQWTQPDGSYRYVVLLFKTDRFSGELCSSEEGEVLWVKKSEIFSYFLADGFEEMVKVFLDDNATELCFTFDGQWHSEIL